MITLLLLGCTGSTPDTGVEPGDTDTDVDTDTDTDPVDTAALADDERVRTLTDLPEGDRPCAEPRLVRVDRAVDGDTFWSVAEDDHSSIKVRIIGLDTPEIAHDDPAECYGDEAAAFTAEQLEDKLVWLTYDADCLDPYDRTLAYVFRDNTEEGFYNRLLLRQGYATVLTISPDDSFSDTFEEDEAAARSDDLGLWGACSR